MLPRLVGFRETHCSVAIPSSSSDSDCPWPLLAANQLRRSAAWVGATCVGFGEAGWIPTSGRSESQLSRSWPPLAAHCRPWPWPPWPVGARGHPWPPLAAPGRPLPRPPVAARGPWPPVATRGRPWLPLAALGRPLLPVARAARGQLRCEMGVNSGPEQPRKQPSKQREITAPKTAPNTDRKFV